MKQQGGFGAKQGLLFKERCVDFSQISIEQEKRNA